MKKKIKEGVKQMELYSKLMALQKRRQKRKKKIENVLRK